MDWMIKIYTTGLVLVHYRVIFTTSTFLFTVDRVVTVFVLFRQTYLQGFFTLWGRSLPPPCICCPWSWLPASPPLPGSSQVSTCASSLARSSTLARSSNLALVVADPGLRDRSCREGAVVTDPGSRDRSCREGFLVADPGSLARSCREAFVDVDPGSFPFLVYYQQPS